MVDHRRQRGRFAGARGADHEDQAALEHDQFLELHRHAEFIERRQVGSNVPQHHRNVATLIEHVDAEAAEALFGQRKVDLEFLVELVHLLFGHQLERRLLHHLGRHLELVDRHDLAFDLDLGRSERREEKVRCLFLDHQLEQWFDVHLLQVPCRQKV